MGKCRYALSYETKAMGISPRQVIIGMALTVAVGIFYTAVCLAQHPPPGCVKVYTGTAFCLGAPTPCGNATTNVTETAGGINDPPCQGTGKAPHWRFTTITQPVCRYCCLNYCYVQLGVEPCPPCGCDQWGNHVVGEQVTTISEFLGCVPWA